MTDVPRGPRTVIGVGNPWRGDDAAGLEAARRLRELVPSDVSVRELEGEPVSLLDAWEGAAAALVVDAVLTGADPGTVHRIEALDEPLPEPQAGASTHALGLAEAIELARVLDRLPGRLVVYGIEAESFEAGERLTPAVASAVEAAAGAIAAELGARSILPERGVSG